MRPSVRGLAKPRLFPGKSFNSVCIFAHLNIFANFAKEIEMYPHRAGQSIAGNKIQLKIYSLQLQFKWHLWELLYRILAKGGHSFLISFTLARSSRAFRVLNSKFNASLYFSACNLNWNWNQWNEWWVHMNWTINHYRPGRNNHEMSNAHRLNIDDYFYYSYSGRLRPFL